MESSFLISIMVAIIVGVLSLIGSILIALISPRFTHRWDIRYFKKEFLFKRKILISDELGKFSWRNHLSLTKLEALKTKLERDAVRLEMKANIKNFIPILDYLTYSSLELHKNLGRYLTLFEIYVNSKDFGSKSSIKELREKMGPFVKAVSSAIEEELNAIK